LIYREVFNGDLGVVLAIDTILGTRGFANEREVKILFDGREVVYDYADLNEVGTHPRLLQEVGDVADFANIPNFNRSIVTSSRDRSTVRTKSDRTHPSCMSYPLSHTFTRRHIPQSHSQIFTTTN